jgi:hypothetical protein
MWRQWKTLRRRREAPIELGVRCRLASNTARSGVTSRTAVCVPVRTGCGRGSVVNRRPCADQTAFCVNSKEGPFREPIVADGIFHRFVRNNVRRIEVEAIVYKGSHVT